MPRHCPEGQTQGARRANLGSWGEGYEPKSPEELKRDQTYYFCVPSKNLDSPETNQGKSRKIRTAPKGKNTDKRQSLLWSPSTTFAIFCLDQVCCCRDERLERWRGCHLGQLSFPQSGRATTNSATNSNAPPSLYFSYPYPTRPIRGFCTAPPTANVNSDGVAMLREVNSRTGVFLAQPWGNGT